MVYTVFIVCCSLSKKGYLSGDLGLLRKGLVLLGFWDLWERRGWGYFSLSENYFS
jgi:hypothetical protein